MRLQARVGEHVFDLEVEPAEEGAALVRLDGAEHRVDLQRVAGDTWSLMVGQVSHELSILQERDGWRVLRGGAEALVRLHDPERDAVDLEAEAEGPQQVTAIMPGRVARVLVEPGQEEWALALLDQDEHSFS